CRCPGSASAGSPRTSASRPAAGGTTPGARAATGGRASTGSRSRARSRGRARGRARRAGRTRRTFRVGVDRRVAALLAADRPRAADVAGLGRLGVVPALAVRLPDRVDRGEVDDVEAEL